MRLADRLKRAANTWAINTVASAIYILSGGRKALREGHYQRWRHRWTNWSRTFETRPRRFEQPTTEEEICRIVSESTQVRVVGGGHSFNASPLADGTLLSLDAYDKVVSIDPESRIATVQAGIRLHELNRQLAAAGLALPVLGSHDRQSLGGLIATDLHGTGRDHGFLSEQILALRIVDAAGVAQTFRPGSDVFHAAVGAIGTCGVVTEVQLQCVPAFRLEKSIQILDRRRVREDIDQIIADNDHVSFYYIGGVDVINVRMNVWNHTDRAPSAGLPLRKMGYELLDIAISGYVLGLAKMLDVTRAAATLGLLFFKVTMDGRITVYPSSSGFARTLFYHHDEMEYGVPYETHRECLEAVLELLRERRFLSIVEVRFTPDASSALIGPGTGRRTCFIELAPSLSVDATEVFAEAEAIFLRYGGQPHLGKKTRASSTSMAALHRERWTRLRAVQQRQDPAGKFQNDFTARIFASAAAAEALA